MGPLGGRWVVCDQGTPGVGGACLKVCVSTILVCFGLRLFTCCFLHFVLICFCMQCLQNTTENTGRFSVGFCSNTGFAFICSFLICSQFDFFFLELGG